MSYRVPAFSYPGGKVKLREWMVRRMPMSGGKYVEPFAGRGSVFWLAVHMLDYKEWWLNDPWTARWFEAIQKVDLRSIPKEMTKLLARIYYRRAMRDRDTDDLAVSIESKVMYGGGPNKSISGECARNPSTSGLIRRLVQARAILSAVRPRITSKDWRDCKLGDLSCSDFVYLDPPYTRKSEGKYVGSPMDHPTLLKYLEEAPHLWMLSGCSNLLYDRYLGAPLASCTVRASMGLHDYRDHIVRRTECIWTNYTMGADGIPKRKRLKMRRISKKRIKK